ncbi:hypothetical protein ACFW82_34785, partial [Streptomyces sp. NPDC058728]
MSRRSRRLAGICASTVAAGLLLLCTGGDPATPPRGASGGAASGTEVAVGAYLHIGSPGVERMQDLSRWLG